LGTTEPDRQAQFLGAVEKSLLDQKDIESKDHQNFDEFLQAYFAQTYTLK
jgi:hypothetical protein